MSQYSKEERTFLVEQAMKYEPDWDQVVCQFCDQFKVKNGPDPVFVKSLYEQFKQTGSCLGEIKMIKYSKDERIFMVKMAMTYNEDYDRVAREFCEQFKGKEGPDPMIVKSLYNKFMRTGSCLEA